MILSPISFFSFSIRSLFNVPFLPTIFATIIFSVVVTSFSSTYTFVALSIISTFNLYVVNSSKLFIVYVNDASFKLYSLLINSSYCPLFSLYSFIPFTPDSLSIPFIITVALVGVILVSSIDVILGFILSIFFISCVSIILSTFSFIDFAVTILFSNTSNGPVYSLYSPLPILYLKLYSG